MVEGKGEKQRGRQEAWATMPMGRGGEKWSGSCFILKVELTGCAGTGCGKERKSRFKDDTKTFED